MGSYRPRWTARWANLSSTETNGHNKSAKWANGRSKAEMAKQQRAAAAAKSLPRHPRALSLSLSRENALSHSLSSTARALLLAVALSLSTYAYVTHRFTRPVAQWFFFLHLMMIHSWKFSCFCWKSRAVFSANFPTLSLLSTLSNQLCRYNIRTCRPANVALHTFPITTRYFHVWDSQVFFCCMITTHWKIQPCYSFSRLISWSVTVGQLLPTRRRRRCRRMIFNKLLYWPSEGRWQLVVCLGVVVLSLCLGQWIFTRSTPGHQQQFAQPHRFSSSSTTLAAAGQVTPLSLADPRYVGFVMCTASVENITYLCIGAAHSTQLALRSFFLMFYFMKSEGRSYDQHTRLLAFFYARKST